MLHLSGVASTTVAILTPPGRGAVAVIGVEGPQATHLVDLFFKPARGAALSRRGFHQIVYGRWGNEPAEDVIACRPSAMQIEVHCHGGSAASARIVEDMVAAGAIQSTWKQWITAAESGPIRRAARIALAGATTERAARVLLDQYHGALQAELHETLDFLAADRREQAGRALQQLLERAPLGLHLTRPWQVVVAGPPNVGKSSLINALLGYQRAVVFDQPGTTRDVVTASTALDGWPVELIDTAGLRVSQDPLESEGVRRATRQAENADCLLLVLDASQSFSDEQVRLVEAWPTALVVHNKIDLVSDSQGGRLTCHWQHPGPDASALTSALTGQGIDDLIRAIVERLVPVAPAPRSAVPFTDQQVERITASARALRSGNVQTARDTLLALLSPES